MLYGEINGGPADPAFDPDVGRVWKALEGRAQDVLRDFQETAVPQFHEAEADPDRLRGTKDPDVSEGRSTQIGLRLRPAQLAALDAWIACQSEPRPKRPEAIRKLLGKAFETENILAEVRSSKFEANGRGEVRLTRLKKLAEELLYHGLTDAAAQAVEIIRSIEREDSPTMPILSAWAFDDAHDFAELQRDDALSG
jgi:hypothetical protein